MDGLAARPLALGLTVTDLGSGAVAGWRGGSALYGFVGLPPGTRRVWISDPEERYVSRAIDVLVSNPPKIVTVIVRPGVRYPIPAGQTSVWGDVVDVDGTPLPYALVRLRHSAGQRWTTTTDATGRFRLWLRGLPTQDSPPQAQSFTLYIRARTQSGSDLTTLWPPDLDALSETALNAWYNRSRRGQSLKLTPYATTRIPTITMS